MDWLPEIQLGQITQLWNDSTWNGRRLLALKESSGYAVSDWKVRARCAWDRFGIGYAVKMVNR